MKIFWNNKQDSPFSSKSVTNNPESDKTGIKEDISLLKTEISDEYIRTESSERTPTSKDIINASSEKNDKTTEIPLMTVKSAISAATGFLTGFAIGEIQKNMELAETENGLKKSLKPANDTSIRQPENKAADCTSRKVSPKKAEKPVTSLTKDDIKEEIPAKTELPSREQIRAKYGPFNNTAILESLLKKMTDEVQMHNDEIDGIIEAHAKKEYIDSVLDEFRMQEDSPLNENRGFSGNILINDKAKITLKVDGKSLFGFGSVHYNTGTGQINDADITICGKEKSGFFRKSERLDTIKIHKNFSEQRSYDFTSYDDPNFRLDYNPKNGEARFTEPPVNIKLKSKCDLKELLHTAVKNRDVESAKLYISAGAHVDTRFNGSTMLTRAAHQGDLDMVKLLVHKGANVFARDKATSTNWGGRTVLHEAVIGDNKDVVELLLSKGAWILINTLDSDDIRGDTPYDCARSNEIKTLLSKYESGKGVVS
ncbi:MAG: ankyrin repeat domain-containing protein [Vulcanimicrobiota bacterium]